MSLLISPIFLLFYPSNLATGDEGEGQKGEEAGNNINIVNSIVY